MGRFKAKAVIVKEVRRTGLTIILYDRETIYVHDNKHGWAVFHRWFAPLGSYGRGWRQFRHLLEYEKNIDFNHCYRLAFRHGIASQKVKKGPDLTKVPIEERISI